MDRNQRLAAFGVVLTVLLIGLGFWIGSEAGRSGNGSAEVGPETSTDGRPTVDGSLAGADSGHDHAHDEGEHAAHHEHEAAASSPKPRHIVVEFQVTDGSPAIHFDFTFAIEHARQPFATDGRQAPRRYGPAPTFSSRGRTDANGRFSLPDDRLLTRQGLRTWLHLAQRDAAIQFVQHSAAVDDLHPQETLIRLDEGVDTYVVKLEEHQLAGFMLVYEDGTPYEGSVSVTAHTTDGRWQSAIKAPSASGEFSVPIPEQLERLAFKVHGKRKGFSALTEYVRHSNDLRAFERLVIKRDYNQAVLRIDLSKWTAKEQVSIAIAKWTGAAGKPKSAKGGDVWESFNLLASESGIRYPALCEGVGPQRNLA